jgi:hypothetical protein
MKRDGIFWGGILVVLGVLFLLQTQGLLKDVFTWFWPFFLILLGSWIILGIYWRPSLEGGETFSIALNGAKEASIKFEHGAGQIDIRGGAPANELLNGSAGRGMEYSSQKSGDRLEAKVSAGPSFIPFIGPDGGVWHFRLNRDIPLYLRVEAGASQIEIDLSDLNVPHARLATGASTTHLTVPARGVSLLDIEAGAATIDIRIPEGVAARVRVKQGVTSLNIDNSRFPRLDNDMYQSPNFDQSPNRVEINVEAGLGTISVK